MSLPPSPEPDTEELDKILEELDAASARHAAAVNELLEELGVNRGRRDPDTLADRLRDRGR